MLCIIVLGHSKMAVKQETISVDETYVFSSIYLINELKRILFNLNLAASE